ncbi:DUF3558 family protein [Streptomyces odontomachi]|uniref:DUF3558 family protein n=1 Tax=Streptomyces odontomachi TaxID=2944940 RepID=UPI002109ED0A|nr:DUF3558 family protein [Streptomyces sp. ODS25]
MRRVVAAAAILACALGLAACGGNGKGNGMGVGGVRSSSSPGSGDTSDAEGSGKRGAPLAGTDPCTLLKPADVPELNKDSTFKPTSSGDTCSGYDFAIRIKDVSKDVYDMDFHGSTVKALPDMAGHRAALSETNVGGLKSCNVVLEVTADELVDVTVTHDVDPPKTCDIAQQAAAVVAGRIPA